MFSQYFFESDKGKCNGKDKGKEKGKGFRVVGDGA